MKHLSQSDSQSGLPGTRTTYSATPHLDANSVSWRYHLQRRPFKEFGLFLFFLPINEKQRTIMLSLKSLKFSASFGTHKALGVLF